MKKMLSKILTILFVGLLLVNTFFVNNIFASNNKYNFSASYSQATVIKGAVISSDDYSFEFDESWFEDSSYVYNHDLAIMQLKAAFAGFSEHNLKNYFTQLGYIYVDNYYLDAMDSDDSIVFPDTHENFDLYDSSKDTIRYGIAYKNIQLASGDIYTVIATVVSGGGYGTEWASNFTVGSEGDHFGFSQAANRIKSKLIEYIGSIDSPYPIKLTITGYSRAAATTNLLGHYMNKEALNNESLNLKPENIYPYCFEVPMGGYNITQESYSYGYNTVNLDDNIFCIVNPLDIVTKVMMDDFDFGFYGVVKTLPSKLTTTDYYNSSFYQNMYKRYCEIIGEDASYALMEMNNQISYFECILYLATDLYGRSRSNYVDSDAQLLGRYIGLTLMDLGYPFTKVKLYYYNSSGDRKLKATFDISSIASEGLNISTIWEFLGALLFPSYEKSYEIEVYTDYEIDHVACKLTKDQLKRIRSIAYDVYGMYNDGLIHIDGIGEAIAYSHYPNLCLAWLESIDGDDLNDYKRYHEITLSTSGEVSIYYKDNLVGKLNSSAVTDMSKSVECYISEDDKMVVRVPSQDGYKTVISYSSSSSLNASIKTYNINTKQLVNTTTYQNISANGTYTLLLDKDKVTLLDNSGKTKQPTLSESVADSSDVTLTINCDLTEGIVEGDGLHYRNELVTLTATENDDYNFVGWYLKDQLLSTEKTFEFLVDSNVTLESKFELSNEKVLANHIKYNDLIFYSRDNNGFTISGSIDDLFRSEIELHYIFNDKDYAVDTTKETFSFDVDIDLDKISSQIEVYGIFRGSQSEHYVVNIQHLYDELVKQQDGNEKTISILETLLAYQKYQQHYLNKDTGVAKLNHVNQYDVKQYSYKVNEIGDKLLIKVKNASLVLNENISLRIYFDLAEEYKISDFDCYVDGQISNENVTIEEDYIQINNIRDISHSYNIKITNQENMIIDFDYSVNSYIYEILRMKDASYDNLKNLMICIYDYGNAIKEIDE